MASNLVPIVYDTGALVAGERNDRRMWARHRQAAEDGIEVIVPSPVVTQAWRNSARQATLARFLRGCLINTVPMSIAKMAGALLGRTGSSDAVDAIVVATALHHGAIIVTSDIDDLAVLWDAAAVARPPVLLKP